MSRWLAAGLTAIGVGWVIAVLLAPLSGADGSVAAWLVYHAGGTVCHQRPDRSFFLAGEPMPVCARCFGLYASGATAALLAWTVVPGSRNGNSRAVLGMAALPTIATIAVEWLGLVTPGSVLRALSALPLGAAAGWIFVGALRSERG
ncbi:MAG TPA: DUF2085 domain-containing protein [Vicinamibacterales bacterium]|nr:DUF2085 domain-containing protein [Vicinamibacterales bacterium]